MGCVGDVCELGVVQLADTGGVGWCGVCLVISYLVVSF